MKSCIPAKEKEEEEVNQEVPLNTLPWEHQDPNTPNSTLPPLPGFPNSSQPFPSRQGETATISWQPTSKPRKQSPQPSQPQLPTSQLSEQHNWQACITTCRERNAVMYNNTLMADVYFTVGTGSSAKRIPAHKYILGCGSTVFYAMLYGGLAEESKISEISVPDVEPAAFLNMLRYLYCEELGQVTADTVLATLYTAKKYMLPPLARACVAYLETSLTAANAALLLSQASLFDESELMSRCWEVIDAQAEESLASPAFTDIDFSTLTAVLSRETLNVRELSVFDAACRWARAECERRDVEASPSNQRQVLGEALKLVRLPCLSLEDFARGPAQSQVLSLEESHALFLHLAAAVSPADGLGFPSAPRRGLAQCRCHRFQSSAYRSNQWRYRGRCDSIQFSTDRRVFVAGLGLYGSSNAAAQYSVAMELKAPGGESRASCQTRFRSDGSSSTFPVLFSSPVQVEPHTLYTASVTLDGPELSFFGQEGLSEVTAGKVTFQFQCSAESTNGTGVQGGQIPEIIFYS